MKRLLMVSNGELIGHLDQDRGGTLRLTAPPTDGMPRLSLGFTPSTSPIPPRKARAYVEGLLPEGEAVRHATARRFGVSPRSPFALLSAIGQDCPGAVQFLSEEQMEAPTHASLVPIDELRIGARLRDLRTNPGATWVTDGEHWSLGGAQSKFALRWESGRWHEAHGTEPTTHIIKPGITALHSQALIEHVCLQTFRLFGLPVARSQFRVFDGEPAIVIERFDRHRYEGTLVRAHQEDLCQATSTLPADKYSVTAADAVTTLRRGGAPAADVETFVRSVLANWLIGAPDAHAKNYSIFLAAEEVALAPLYDVSTGFGQGQPWPTMAMSIGGAKTFSDVTPRHLQKFAEAVGVDAEYVLAHARLFADGMPAAFAMAVKEMEAPGTDRAQLQKIEAELAAHCQRVRDALRA